MNTKRTNLRVKKLLKRELARVQKTLSLYRKLVKVQEHYAKTLSTLPTKGAWMPLPSYEETKKPEHRPLFMVRRNGHSDVYFAFHANDRMLSVYDPSSDSHFHLPNDSTVEAFL